MICKIEFKTRKDHPKRSVCFLVSDENKNNAKNKFDNLRDSDERGLRVRFDYWVNGRDDYPKYYHGWDKSEFGGKYARCFVFKRNSHRFYGFLCNPKKSNPGYQLCVLICHDIKKGNKTHKSKLNYTEKMRNNEEITRLINKEYE